MRRADRLFQIVQVLRGRRLTTARKLAETLEVSERTIYRDIADLQASGVPVEGEAGVGYVMQGGFDLPPLMFTHDEVVALVAGARLIQAFGGLAMARAAEEAMVKIDAVLPEAERGRAASVQIHAMTWDISDQVRDRIDHLDRAVETRQVLILDYADAAGTVSQREIRPLSLVFWGKVWTLIAWCDLRGDFRMFRLDRIAGQREAGRRFRPERGRDLPAFYAKMEAQDRARVPSQGPGD